MPVIIIIIMVFVVLHFLVCGQGSHCPNLRLGGGLSVRVCVCFVYERSFWVGYTQLIPYLNSLKINIVGIMNGAVCQVGRCQFLPLAGRRSCPCFQNSSIGQCTKTNL